MKKLLLLLVLLLTINLSAQTYKKVGDSLVKIEKETVKVKAEDTGMTVVKSKKEYPVYKSARGKYFIIRTSKNTGKQYKQYLKIEE